MNARRVPSVLSMREEETCSGSAEEEDAVKTDRQPYRFVYLIECSGPWALNMDFQCRTNCKSIELKLPNIYK